MDEPFDVISMDIWYPGSTLSNTTTTKNQKAILTCLDNLTGFANLAFFSQVTSETVARLAFSHFFVPNGLPKLVIVDGGSDMKGVLIAMCEQIGIPYYQVPPEAHNSILCERFHRYLNKVEKIGAADAESYEKWAMNALFAAYAWNGSPVDGTDIIRSFAAKARTFHFPLDIQTGEEIARIPEQGEATIQHLETMFPLWFRQKELLKELTKDRREHHRELANKNKRDHPNISTRRSGISTEASEFKCDRRQTGETHLAGQRPLSRPRSSRGQLVLYPENAGRTIAHTPPRQTHEGIGYANGTTSILHGGT